METAESTHGMRGERSQPLPYSVQSFPCPLLLGVTRRCFRAWLFRLLGEPFKLVNEIPLVLVFDAHFFQPLGKLLLFPESSH